MSEQQDTQVFTVELGGKERKAKFSIAGIEYARMEHDVEFTMSDFMRFDLSMMPTLAWIAMLPFDPQLDKGQVLQWLAMSDDEDAVYEQIMRRIGSFVELIGRAAGNLEQAAEKVTGKNGRTSLPSTSASPASTD